MSAIHRAKNSSLSDFEKDQIARIQEIETAIRVYLASKETNTKEEDAFYGGKRTNNSRRTSLFPILLILSYVLANGFMNMSFSKNDAKTVLETVNESIEDSFIPEDSLSENNKNFDLEVLGQTGKHLASKRLENSLTKGNLKGNSSQNALETQEEINNTKIENSSDANINIDNTDVPEGIELTYNSLPEGLIDFNPDNFCRCPDDVTTEELLEIFGITSEQFEIVYGIICAESWANLNGYVEVYNCFYTLLNRICDSSYWTLKYGTNIYYQAIAPEQYVAYQNNLYNSYLKYSDEEKEMALAAMRDAMYNFIVDPTHGPHTYMGFRDKESKSYSENQFTLNGNRYASPLTNTKYPAFLESEEAIALRNKAFVIFEETLEYFAYDYKTNTFYIRKNNHITKRYIQSSDSPLTLIRTLN